jgi:pilus assembly protein TadC
MRSSQLKTSTRLAVSGLASLAVTVLFGGITGVGIGIVSAVITYYLLGRLEPSSVRVAKRRLAAQLPFALELLAAVLRAGSPVPHALNIVAQALRGPVGTWWRITAGMLELGTSPAQAWRASPTGSASVHSVVEMMIRAADSGAALASGCERIALRLRDIQATELLKRAKQTSVLIVLPLTTCLLPAFVLWGVMPIVIDLLTDIHQL